MCVNNYLIKVQLRGPLSEPHFRSQKPCLPGLAFGRKKPKRPQVRICNRITVTGWNLKRHRWGIWPWGISYIHGGKINKLTRMKKLLEYVRGVVRYISRKNNCQAWPEMGYTPFFQVMDMGKTWPYGTGPSRHVRNAKSYGSNLSRELEQNTQNGQSICRLSRGFKLRPILSRSPTYWGSPLGGFDHNRILQLIGRDLTAQLGSAKPGFFEPWLGIANRATHCYWNASP